MYSNHWSNDHSNGEQNNYGGQYPGQHSQDHYPSQAPTYLSFNPFQNPFNGHPDEEDSEDSEDGSGDNSGDDFDGDSNGDSDGDFEAESDAESEIESARKTDNDSVKSSHGKRSKPANKPSKSRGAHPMVNKKADKASAKESAKASANEKKTDKTSAKVSSKDSTKVSAFIDLKNSKTGGKSNSSRPQKDSKSPKTPSLSAHLNIRENLNDPKGKRYKSKELSYELQRNANTLGDELNTRLKSWQRKILQGTIPHLKSDSDILALMTTWLGILDHALFFNTIRKGLRPRKPIVLEHNHQDSSTEGSFYRIPFFSYISLNVTTHTNHPHNDGSPGWVARNMISTLAHEMLHAFLEMYSCQCKHCFKRRTPESAEKGGCGASGHGPNWINAAVAIERALESLVDWDVDLGILTNLAVEIATRSGWKPRSEQLERWGIDEQVLDDTLEGLEEEELESWWCVCPCM